MKITTNEEGLITATSECGGLTIRETSPGNFRCSMDPEYRGVAPHDVIDAITTARLDATIANQKAGLQAWARAFSRSTRA